jgi:serine/threonine protein kinase
MTHLLALPAGTELVGDYRIERVLGAGGFGITYLAQEVALARDVTIKEYFPGDFAARKDSHDAVPRSQDCAGDYQWGLDRFIAEAQTLARFDHRNIVRVYRYFRANNTGYMVLHFEEGQSLKSWLKSLGRAPRQKEIDQFLAPLLDALELIHKADFLHRDIAPDNVIVRPDGAPVLIDFGSARGDIARHSRTVSALVKPGYSPYEQYAEIGSQQGPWTDIYALAATLYHAITGKRPPDSPSRVVKDEIIPAREAALSSYRPGFLAAVDRALLLDIEKRPQSVAEWRGALLAPEPRKQGWLQRTISRRPKDEDAAAIAPAATVALTSPVPPPPDAPGAQGGLLDYIDRLKQKSAGSAAQLPDADKKAAAAEVAELPAPSQAKALAPTVVLPKPKAKAKAKVKSKAEPSKPVPPVVAKPEKQKRIRPRRVRTGDERSWWPLGIKLMIGVAVASLAVSFQDRLPSFGVGESVSTTGTAREVREATAVRETRDVRETREVREPEPPPRVTMGHSGGVLSLAFTDDGRSLVTAGADGTLKLWDADRGTETRTISLGAGRPTSVAVQGRQALTGHEDGTIQLWHLDSGTRIGEFKRNAASVWSVAFLDQPGRFMAAAHDWTVSVWDAASPSAPSVVMESEGPVQAVAYTPRGYIASGGADRQVRLWNPTSGSEVRVYRGHRDFVTALAFSSDGRILASAGLDGSIRLWSTASRRLQRTLPRHAKRVTDLAFSPSGEYLASASEDGTVRLWNFQRGRLLRRLNGTGSGFRTVQFSPDGQRLAAGGDAGVVREWGMAKLISSQ